jgi:ABC-type nitrate/sulfonate/bicarbonate transport system substrate-binding protein
MERIRVNVFAGLANIPLLVGGAQGFFAGEGLSLEIQRTRSSQAQRAALLDGAAVIAHASFDDAVSGVEDVGADFVAFMGGDGGFQAFYARPPAKTLHDLRGQVVAVDDPETGYALVLRAMLRRVGLREADYVLRPVGSTDRRFQAIQRDASLAAAMFAPPYSVMVEDLGWHRIGSTPELLGPYQGTVGFCRRAWLGANRPLLSRYLRAYLRGLRWALDPNNRPAVTEAIMTSLGITPSIAQRATAAAFADGGLAPDAVFDLPGLRGVLAIRAEICGQWAGSPPAPESYLDPSPHQEALGTLPLAAREEGR